MGLFVTVRSRGSRAVALIALLAASSAGFSADRFYDGAFDDAMRRYDLPGLAVGVIDNGKVVYERGAGERVAGSGRAVDADTLFKIGSNTKAMTTALLARLAAAGKLDWDAPVTKYLPEFRMHDAWVTQNMLVRDLLVHNSGLREGAGDLMLWPQPNRFTRSDIIAGLAHLKPQISFRSGYAYDNLLYVVAGEVAAAAGGASYEELMAREVFEPLGLGCRVGQWKSDEVANVAQPHARKDGRNVVVDADGAIVPAITSGAAGGIRCSLRDMLAWAQNWLAPDSKQLAWLGEEQRRILWTAHTPMPVGRHAREWNHTHYYAYALGWRLADVDGAWTVSHTGTLNGMYSALTLLPDCKSAFVFMTNGAGDEARTTLSEVMLKHFTAPSERHSIAEYADAIARENAAPAARHAPDTSARKPLLVEDARRVLGVWRDPWFGLAMVCAEQGVMRFRALRSPLLTGRLMHVGDRVLVDWDDDRVDAEAWLDVSGSDTQERRLQLAKVDPGADFSFDFEDLSFERIHDCE